MNATEFPDLMGLLVAVSRVIPFLIILMQAVVALVGLCLVAKGAVSIYVSSQDNADKFFTGTTNYSYSLGFICMFIGTLLIGMADLQVIGILSRSFTGGYTTEVVMAQALTYGTGNSFSERTRQATLAIFSIFQAVGFFAISRGFFGIYEINAGKSTFGYGGASAFIIAGVFCWNMQWFVQRVENTIGFSFIGLFTPFL